MKFTPEQSQQIAQWVSQGLTLGDIQKQIRETFQQSLTFMEVRFLVDDLGLVLKDKEAEKPEKNDASDATESVSDPAEDAMGDGTVKVTVDNLIRPGALVSGDVVFSDGMKATWYVDQMGRLGLSPAQTGYQPSQTDVQEFQMALQSELRKKGL